MRNEYNVRVVTVAEELARGNHVAIALVARAFASPRNWLVIDTRVYNTPSGRGAEAFGFENARSAAVFAAALLGPRLFREDDPQRLEPMEYDLILARAVHEAEPGLTVTRGKDGRFLVREYNKEPVFL